MFVNTHQVRDLILYLFWIGLYMTIIFLNRDVNAAHRIEHGINSIIIDQEIKSDKYLVLYTFPTIGEVEEWWDWLTGPVLEALSAVNDEEEVSLAFYNRLLGSVRLRQMRVRPDSCEITSVMKPFMSGCYASYSESTMDTAPYGPDGRLIETFVNLISDGNIVFPTTTLLFIGVQI